MRLKSLEIQGFKSFPDKTSFAFGDGLTAIVGPNGSGKSNISDSVRWVLGEQSTKTLRGERMEDVIFSGTESRKSLGFAEVSLVLDNSSRSLKYDSDEVVVTRKYYRSGESEYMINRQAVRLKDIRELFMDTGLGRDGYSIVGQGKIADIVSAKSDDRREIFEEAAGISKYRYRKNEAEKRLVQAQDNVLRLKDILLELEGRVEPLRVQSEKAKKYLVLADEKRKIEVSLWVKTLEQSGEKLRDLEYKLTALNTSRENIMNSLDKVDAVIEQIDRDSQTYLAEIEAQRAKKQANEEQDAFLKQQKAVFENDILHNNETIVLLETEIVQLSTDGNKISAETDEKKEVMQKTETELAKLEEESNKIDLELEKLTGLTENYKSELDKLQADLVAFNIKITRDTVAVSALGNNKKELSERILVIEQSIERKEEQLTELQKESHACRAVLQKGEDEAAKINNTLKGYELKYQSVVTKKEGIQKKIDESNLSLNHNNQRIKLLSELENNLEGFSGSVKKVVADGKRGALRGIVGTVSQIITVDAKFALAVETALGAAMQNIVVETEENAKSAIYSLKRENAGRATFLPINTIKGRTLNEQGLDACEGFLGVGSDIVKYNDRHSEIIKWLLGRIVFVDNLDNATVIAKKYSYRFKAVTLDGQVINAGGSLTGGSAASKTGVLTRKFEIEKLQQQNTKIQNEIKQLEEEFAAVSEQLASAEAYLSGAKAELSVLSEDKIKYSAEQKRLNLSIEELETALDQLDAEKMECAGKISAIDIQARELEAKLSDSRKAKENAENRISELSGGQNDTSVRAEELSAKSTDIKFKILAMQKDLETVSSDIVRLNAQVEESSSRSKALHNQKAQLVSANAELKQKIEESENARNELVISNTKCDETIALMVEKRTQCEQKIDEIRKNERSQFDEREKLTGEITRLEERKVSVQKEHDNIIFKLYTEYELDRTQAETIAEPIENLTEAQSHLSQIKSKIRSLGAINVDAIEEYKEVSERYEFLKAQLDDVEKSREEILRLINELTSQMKEMFLKSFSEIRDNFSKIFVELFGGGKATLNLTDPENILESGIEIFVQPPGKIIKNLVELSGGEQSFIAIAIYLSILKVKPAPFCFLDEIEAALDEVNVQKYAKYLRKVSDKTQFIMITHRRGSMEEADRLYGITMQEKGVSKLLEMNLGEVESKLGIKSEN